MKRSYILGLLSMLVVFNVGVVLFIINKYDKELVSDVTTNNEVNGKEEFISTVDIHNGWENVTHSKRLDEWKSGDEMFHENLIQEIIQQMAHQKVIADEKESSIMIIPKRINALLQIVEENADSYEHSDKYLDILGRWKEGNFNTVDNDHNVVMEIQGTKFIGGKARGIATKEQEIHYILFVFGKVVDKVFDSSTLKEFEMEDEKVDYKTNEKIDLSWVDDVHADMLDEWKSGDKTFDERLVEEVLRDMMHYKLNIHVEEGSIAMTPERIDKLIQIVEEEKGFFYAHETYLEMLERWGKNDFSTIDDDHNAIHDFLSYR